MTRILGFNPAMLRNEYVSPFEQHNQGRSVGDNLPIVPENDRCTVRCTGVPTKIDENEVLAHFKSFGKVLCFKKIAAPPAMEDKKTYNEFLFQFDEHDAAHRCVNSPKPVLDNRFIRLNLVHFNLVQLADIPNYIAEGKEVDVNGVKKVVSEGTAREDGSHGKSPNPAKEKQAALLKKKYEDLMQLRQNQEEIYKKKEQLLQVCRTIDRISS